MKIQRRCFKGEALTHWKQVDRLKECPHKAVWRERIWAPLPTNMEWYKAEVEEKDLERIFVISSNEWSDLSRSFRVVDISEKVAENTDNEIACEILGLTGKLRENPESFDRKIIMVGASFEGNFTLIDGNKRAIALNKVGKLIGNNIYLGISPKITSYRWAEQAMLSQKSIRNLHDPVR
jgi:hypothetical protein